IGDFQRRWKFRMVAEVTTCNGSPSKSHIGARRIDSRRARHQPGVKSLESPLGDKGLKVVLPYVLASKIAGRVPIGASLSERDDWYSSFGDCPRDMGDHLLYQ